MSFSGEIKKELAGQIGGGRHCQLAELSAIVAFAGKISTSDGSLHLRTETANPSLKKKYRLLLNLLFSIEETPDGLKEENLLRVLESIKMWDAINGRFRDMETVDGLLIQQDCCRRAFIRGAFLACGSMSNPGKSYHFEIVCRTKKQAMQLKNAIGRFEIDAKIVKRKKSQVLYVKEGAHIVDLLNVMEAHAALMDLENVRIVKEMRNSVNRQVNCETANISKTVTAAVRQMEDIEYIQREKGLGYLPEHLQEVARLRLEYPEAPLKELGMRLSAPLGKSGVNHRLRRICEAADELRLHKKGRDGR